MDQPTGVRAVADVRPVPIVTSIALSVVSFLETRQGFREPMAPHFGSSGCLVCCLTYPAVSKAPTRTTHNGPTMKNRWHFARYCTMPAVCSRIIRRKLSRAAVTSSSAVPSWSRTWASSARS